jgi:hypothetical protein
MVDDPETSSIEEIHRIPVATIARWWMMRKRPLPKISTAWPRWLPDVGMDDAEMDSSKDLHRIPVATIDPCSHHRQMVDDPETSSIEEIHRVAAVDL